MRLSLKTKLLGSFAIVLLLMAIVAYMGISLSGQLNSNVVDLGKTQVKKVELTGKLETLLATMRRYELQALVRGNLGDKKAMADYLNKIQTAIQDGDKANAELGTLLQSAEGKKLFQEFNQNLKSYLEKDQQLRQYVNEGRYLEGIEFFNTESKQAFDATVSTMTALSDLTNKYVAGKITDSQNLYNQSSVWSIIMTAVAMVVSITIGLWLSFSITKVISQMVAMLKDMAQSGGDLTKRVEVNVKDEIGDLAKWFNAFLDNLHDIMAQVRQSSETVTSAANETSLGNQDLSQRTEEQASSLEEISSTIEEITSSLQKSSESSGDADRISRTTLQTVRSSEEVVKDMQVAMVEITKGSHAIAEIIAKVNDIAFQTNLLALNAAVEAARAGEQGRGFAVVAAEVRNLAGRTAESAKEIEGLIKDSIVRVDKGNQLMDDVSKVLGDVVSNTEHATEVIMEIAASMKEQSAAAEDIRMAVDQLNQVTQQNASLVEEIAGSSEAVSSEAEELSGLVGKFRLKESVVLGGVRTSASAGAKGKPVRKPAVGAKQKVAATTDVGFNENDFERF